MERYDIRVNVWGDVSGPQYEWETVKAEDGVVVLYTDAQATVEALQAQLPAEMQGCTILFKECEKGHGRLVATNWRDHGCQTCEVEALQRERDGAYKQGFADALEKVASDWASKEFRGHDEIQGVEVQAFLDSRHVHYEECRGVKPLQAALNAEREKVKELEQQVQDQSTSNLEIMRHTDDMQSRALDAERALAQLQALVRALVGTKSFTINGPDIRTMGGSVLYACSSPMSAERLGALLEYRERTLDATTPAVEQVKHEK